MCLYNLHEWAYNMLKYNGTRVKLHKHIHIYKGIQIMVGVGWSLPLLALVFIPIQHLLVHTIHVKHHTPLFPQIVWGYSNLIHLYSFYQHNRMTTTIQCSKFLNCAGKKTTQICQIMANWIKVLVQSKNS